MKLNIATLVVAILVLLALFVLTQGMGLPWTPMRIAGMALAIPSFLLLIVARLQLGRAFSVQARATTLVTTGLYSRIRNPIYLFGGLGIAGVFLFAGKLWLFLFFLPLIPMQIHRSRKEEQVLTEKFGADYLAYKSKTWF